MDTIKRFLGLKPARLGRPANETDRYAQNRNKWMQEEARREFEALVGPNGLERLPVRASNPSPKSQANSSTPLHISEATIAGPSGTTSSPPTDASPMPPQALATSRSVPVYSLSDVKSTLRRVIGIIPTSSLQAEMEDLYGCCLVLITLLEKGDPSMESAPHYSYIFSKMQQDLNDITKVLSEWTNKKSSLQQMHRKDVHLQVRDLEDVFTRHLNVFVALSQSESTTAMNREFADLQAKMGTIQRARVDSNSNPLNTEQADSDVLRERVRQITGHTPDSAYILNGKISYRESVPLTSKPEPIFDIYKGELKDGEAIAIKLFRTPLKNDGEGVHSVKRLMRQVQLWTSFSSPFILECRGLGMQMSMSTPGQEYERFQLWVFGQ